MNVAQLRIALQFMLNNLNEMDDNIEVLFTAENGDECSINDITTLCYDPHNRIVCNPLEARKVIVDVDY